MKQKFIESWNKYVDTAFNTNDKDKIYQVMTAYNDYQTNECGSADYIFDYSKQSDLTECVDCGLKAEVISNMVVKNEQYDCFTTFFKMKTPNEVTLLTIQSLKDHLCGCAEDIIKTMILYPHTFNMVIYNEIITFTILSEQEKEN